MIVYLWSALLVLGGLAGLLVVALWHAHDVNAELRSENARLRDRVGQLLRRRGSA